MVRCGQLLPLSVWSDTTVGKEELLDLVLESIVVGAEGEGEVEL